MAIGQSVRGAPRREIAFSRLTEISPDEILAHMSDPRIATHLPLLRSGWDRDEVTRFVAAKEARWRRDGLGHWAILYGGDYVGWGGFQREGDEWDFGLVLKPEYFGLGLRIAKQALVLAVADERIDAVTFLLPLSRRSLGMLFRLGAEYVHEVQHQGVKFLKFRLNTRSAR